MKRRLFALLLCLILVFSALCIHAGADFGDFAGDNDYGGGNDWGDSDWGGSDWDDDDGGFAFIGGGGSSGGGGGSIVGPFIVCVVVCAVIVLIAYLSSKNKKGGRRPIMPGAQRTDSAKLRPMAEYQTLDAKFDEGALTQRLSNWYVQMQNAWSAGDIGPVRPFFSDGYYAQMERQLNNLTQAGRTDHTERIAVLGVTLRGFFQSGGEDHIVAELRTRIVSYVTDKTGKVISGSQTAEKFMTYEWDLTRPSGTITQEGAEMQSINCPHCGAAISINESAKCPYCDSVITLDQHDWVIASIKGISQRTSG